MATESATVRGLFERVAMPLVLGGPFRPLEPIGPQRATDVAQQASQGLTVADMSWVSVARVRQARRLCPVDVLPPISQDEWLMIVVLNDLIRSTDPEVKGLFSPGKAAQIVQGALGILAQVSAARTLGQALARHATFARVMSLQRTDTTISWWCGSSVFAGRTPPARLLSWPQVRRVRTQRATLDVATMGARHKGMGEVYEEALRALLARTPLTDLATAGRQAPPFVWTSPTVSMMSGPGRQLALRALRMGDNAISAVRKAGLPQGATAVQSVVEELGPWG
jgi:hypothetical protein